MKNKAFTLAEILIVLVILGALSVVMMQSLRSDNFSKKEYIAKAYKVINTFDEAAVNIRDINSTDCPMGTFLYKSAKNADGTYDYELGLKLPASNQDKAVLDIFGKYIKFEKTNLNFCDYSGYCENVNKDIETEADKITNIPAVRFSKNMYAGLKLLSEVSDCPDYYLPEISSKITPKTKVSGEKPQCWAKLYADVNGIDAPNELGKDIFVFGLDENGIYH